MAAVAGIDGGRWPGIDGGRWPGVRYQVREVHAEVRYAGRARLVQMVSQTLVVTCIVMAYIAMTYIVMVYIVMAYIVMAYRWFRRLL